MNDQEFKMDVVERLSRIETKLEERPPCIQHIIKGQIKSTKNMIYATYALFLALVMKYIFGV